MKDEVYISPNLSASLFKSIVVRNQKPGNILDRLSGREIEILRLIGEGYTTREIATNLGISAKTVESHRGNIRQKLKLGSGAELIRFALSQREIPG